MQHRITRSKDFSIAASPPQLTHVLFTLTAFVLNPRAAVMDIIAWGLCVAMVELLCGFQDSRSALFPQSTGAAQIRAPPDVHVKSKKSTAGSLRNIVGQWIHWLMICGTNRNCITPHVDYGTVCVSKQDESANYSCLWVSPTEVCNEST